MAGELVPTPGAVPTVGQAFKRDDLFAAMVEAHAAHVEQANMQVHPYTDQLRERLRDGERLRLFAQTHDVSGSGLAKEKRVLLVETDRRLLLLSAAGGIIEQHRLDAVEGVEFRNDFLWGSKLRLRASRNERTFKQVLPYHEGPRLLEHLANANGREIAPGVPIVPDTPPVSHFANMSLYEDRLQANDNGQLRQWPLDGGVTATVDTAGNIAVVRGRNLAAKGWGTAATMAVGLGPLGAFMFGNAENTEIDTRETYLLVEGRDWAYTALAGGEAGYWARRFAQYVNLVGRLNVPAEQTAEPGPVGSGDPLERLKLLGELRDSGVLTEQEFQTQKARILSDN